MRIETDIGKGRLSDWVKCDHDDWTEIIEDGWEFTGLDKNGNVIMIRRGYMNCFRQVEE